MNWIRKTIIFVSLLIIAFFAAQANDFVIPQSEGQKTDTNFSIDHSDSQSFIQPQASYQLVGNFKTSHPALIKWFDTLLVVVPQHKALNSVSNFANQFATQSKKVLLMLYPFHFFW